MFDDIVEILGVRIHNVTMREAVARIEQFIHSGSSNLVVTLGTEMVMDAQKNDAFRNLVNRAALVLPDGGGLLWASKVLGTPIRERVAGIDLTLQMCRRSAEKNWKLFFLGGKPGIPELAAENVRKKISGAQIVGTHHGYNLSSDLFETLRALKPDILFVGMGFPRQEFWIDENLKALRIPVGIGVGGSFDVLAGKLKRAPAWMMRLNLEWLFRFFQEPRRFFRILKIPIFMSKIYSARVEKMMRKR